MSCALTSDLTQKVCKTPAGIKEILVTEFANITGGAAGWTYTANVVTAVAMVVPKEFRVYKMKAATSDFKVNATASGANGSYSYAYEVNGQFLGIDTATQEELELLMKNTVVVILGLNDGTYWVLGQEFGMDVATKNFESGVALGDFMGDNVQLTGIGTIGAKKVTTALIAELIAPAEA
jgi:hypothetical protein